LSNLSERCYGTRRDIQNACAFMSYNKAYNVNNVINMNMITLFFSFTKKRYVFSFDSDSIKLIWAVAIVGIASLRF